MMKQIILIQQLWIMNKVHEHCDSTTVYLKYCSGINKIADEAKVCIEMVLKGKHTHFTYGSLYD